MLVCFVSVLISFCIVSLFMFLFWMLMVVSVGVVYLLYGMLLMLVMDMFCGSWKLSDVVFFMKLSVIRLL